MLSLVQYFSTYSVYISVHKICIFGFYDMHIYTILTPWSTVLLEKLTSLQLVKKFPTFYGTRRFITAFTSARHLSIS